MDLVIRNARLRHRDTPVDIGIKNGTFLQISPNITETAKDEIDAKGKLVSPPFVESHVHLDDALSAGNPRPNKSGTLQEAIAIAAERKRSLTTDEVVQSAKKAVTWLVANGVQAIRAHTDYSPDFKKLDAIVQVKEAMKDLVDIQIVAFPQEGVFLRNGEKELLEEAVKRGVDAIGGLPQAEITREDGIEQIKLIFELAEKYDKLIDIHTDETGDSQSRYLEVIAKYALRYSMPGRVTASHTTALHNYQNDYAAKVIQHVKQAEMNIVTNPTSNALLQNRLDGYPKYRGVTRVDELLEAGVNVSIGNDNIMDPFGPLGKGNMLQTALLLAHTAHLSSPKQLKDLFSMITHFGATTLQLSDYGIKEGLPANCIILDAKDEAEAIRRTSDCLYVIRKGKVIAETTPATHRIHLDNESIDVDFIHR